MNILDKVNDVRRDLTESIIGQSDLVDRLLIAVLADGHLLVEGAPGLAKTRAVKSLAEHLDGSFQRIQFTPDLLPADITGTDPQRCKVLCWKQWLNDKSRWVVKLMRSLNCF